MATSQPTLAAQLDALRREAAARLGREVFEDFQQATRRLEATGIESRALAVGAVAPGFTLPDATGKQVPCPRSWRAGRWC